MFAPFRTTLMLAAVAANGCAASDPPPSAVPTSPFSATSAASGTLPLRLCLRTGDRSLDAIRAGETRLLLELGSAASFHDHTGPLTLRLLDTDGRSRWEEPFGMHAAQRDGSGQPLPQRFQFHLQRIPEGAVVAIAGEDTLCFELDQRAPGVDARRAVALEAKLGWQE